MFASVTNQKAVILALSIVDCSAGPHLLRVLVKVKKIFAKRPGTLFVGFFLFCPNPCQSGLAWYVDVEQ